MPDSSTPRPPLLKCCRRYARSLESFASAHPLSLPRLASLPSFQLNSPFRPRDHCRSSACRKRPAPVQRSRSPRVQSNTIDNSPRSPQGRRWKTLFGRVGGGIWTPSAPLDEDNSPDNVDLMSDKQTTPCSCQGVVHGSSPMARTPGVHKVPA